MLVTALSLTYLGVALCYVASSSAPSGVATSVRDIFTTTRLRLGGVLMLAAGFAVATLVRPAVDGLLVWLSMVIAACSLLAIGAPLIDRFVPVSSGVALVAVILSLWA